MASPITLLGDVANVEPYAGAMRSRLHRAALSILPVAEGV